MKRAITAAMVLAFASGPAVAGERRTVSWYMANPAARDRDLRACWDDEAEARKPHCANAARAADRAAAADWLGPRRRRPADPAPMPVPTPNQILTSPSYYAANPIAREITIDRCRRGMARGGDCVAALAALTPRR